MARVLLANDRSPDDLLLLSHIGSPAVHPYVKPTSMLGDHKNHIHFDTGVRVLPIRRDAPTDTTLIQATCRYMNGENLAIDGEWGPATEAAYIRLRRALGMQCRSPRRNVRDARLFLQLIARNGMAGVRAGAAFPGPCAAPSE